MHAVGLFSISKFHPQHLFFKAPATDVEDDYCDPIDVQRKDDYIQEMRSQPIKDDYCEPWDSTMKTDATNVSSKNAKKSDDESSEYLEPYDTGRVGIIEKRWSHGIGVQFGKDQRRSAAEGDPKQPVFDPRFVIAFGNALF